jgi:hypothetical protein
LPGGWPSQPLGKGVNIPDSGLSNARIDANNVHMQVLTRQGYG